MDGLGMPALIYLAAVNSWAFALFGMDKAAARRRGRRIPEKRLFAVSILGGALGAWAGMKVWRHKTLHRTFRIGIPLLIAANVICAWLVYRTANSLF